MDEEKIKYLAKRRKVIEDNKIDKELLRNPSGKIEQHHPVGIKNLDFIVPLEENVHKYISSKQDSLSVEERKNLKIHAQKSVLAWFEAGCEFLRFIIEREIQDGKGSN